MDDQGSVSDRIEAVTIPISILISRCPSLEERQAELRSVHLLQSNNKL
jgi:hypothetical protein